MGIQSAYIIIFLFLFPVASIAQKQQDTAVTKALPTDIYDNFERQKNTAAPKSYIIIKSETPGKILFEGAINNNQCSSCYEKLAGLADSCFQNKHFKDAVLLYSNAFKLNNNKGKIKHRLNAACAWTILGNNEAAFSELNRIVFVGKFTNYFHVESNDCFKPLHSDKRWVEILEGLKANLYESGRHLPSDIKN